MAADKKLPLFLHNQKTSEIFELVAASIPLKTRVYLIGGAIRNAVYYKYFKKELPPRDYDLLLIGDKKGFVRNLRRAGFIYGKINLRHEVTLKMKLVTKPKHINKDYLTLDIHISAERSVLKNLKNHANFSINVFALSLKDIFKKDWFDKSVSLPGALKDIEDERLKLNRPGYLGHPANLFACLRFMSLGFKQPPKAEVSLLLKSLGGLEAYRYERNVKKVFGYVGGEAPARKLVKKLGIKQDIFDFEVVKTLK